MNLRHTTSLSRLSLSASTLKSVFGTPRHDHASDPLPLAVAGESLALIAHLTASASSSRAYTACPGVIDALMQVFAFEGVLREQKMLGHARICGVLSFLLLRARRPSEHGRQCDQTDSDPDSELISNMLFFLLLSVSFLSPTIDSLCPDWDVARRPCAVLPFTLPTTTPSQIDRLSVDRSLIFESDRLGLVRVILYRSSSIHMYVHLISLRAEYVPG